VQGEVFTGQFGVGYPKKEKGPGLLRKAFQIAKGTNTDLCVPIRHALQKDLTN